MRKFRRFDDTGSELAYFYVRRQLEHCRGINRSFAAVTNTDQHFHFLSAGTRLFALPNEKASCVLNEESSRPGIRSCEANKQTGYPHSAVVNFCVMIGTTLLVGCPTFRLVCGCGPVQHIDRASCGYSGAKLLLSSCRAAEYVQTMRQFQFLERSHTRVYSN
jgi:hypothetical protein